MKSGYERIGRTISLEAAKRSCLDKKRYASKNDARDAATKVKVHHRTRARSGPTAARCAPAFT